MNMHIQHILLTIAISSAALPIPLRASHKVGLGSILFIGPSSEKFNKLPLMATKRSFPPKLESLSEWPGVELYNNTEGTTTIEYRKEHGMSSFVYLFLPYRSLWQEELETAFLVIQNNAIIIEGDQLAIAGPLYPCLGVFVTHRPSSRTLVMHADETIKVDTILTKIRHFLSQNNKNEYAITMYTKEIKGRRTQELRYEEIVGWAQLNGYKNSTALIFDQDDSCTQLNHSCPFYTTASSNIVITGKGELFNTCMGTECIKLYELAFKDEALLDGPEDADSTKPLKKITQITAVLRYGTYITQTCYGFNDKKILLLPFLRTYKQSLSNLRDSNFLSF